MIKNIIDETIAYMESCFYLDVCERLNAENKLKLKYSGNWSDKVDEEVQKAINNNHDVLCASIFNRCCDVFELNDEERKELMECMLNE